VEAFLQDYASAVQRGLSDFIAREQEVPVLNDGLRYALGLDSAQAGHGGKRCRGAVCLLTSEGLGVSRDRALPLALAVELLHQFLLVHDDLEDGDEVRRRRPAVWVRYGIAHATNVGDFLAAKTWEALLCLSDNGWGDNTALQLLGLLKSTLLDLGRGQARDLTSVNRHNVGLSEYESIAQQKTGSCWSFTLLGPAILAGATISTRDGLQRYANAVGVTYQIVDDVLDLTEAKGRTQAASDIRHGRPTWPVIFAAGQCTAGERGRLFEILDRPPHENREEDVGWVLDLLRRSGAIIASRQRIAQLEREASVAVQELPEPLRTQLETLSQSLAQREA